ncbi:hypothetical protein KPL71_014696 [Citrus sinensis]|uniref:Uncharacterized protein n=1 Tax=Citrus sinensis TaxID=2711 RepID=A0ACB8KDK8_CITSI|nr:hypothetical protein KPL71_014696 [Citrus sinensis]
MTPPLGFCSSPCPLPSPTIHCRRGRRFPVDRPLKDSRLWELDSGAIAARGISPPPLLDSARPEVHNFELPVAVVACGVLTVEIEHVDVAIMEKLEQQGVDCQPKVSTIRIIQDKYIQKVHFSLHGIPLPEFMEVNDLESATRAGKQFGYPLMVKSKSLAYDGRGNAVAKSEEELSSAITAVVPRYWYPNALGGFDRGLYIEKWAPFVKLEFSPHALPFERLPLLLGLLQLKYLG